jgi:hypothetical protein
MRSRDAAAGELRLYVSHAQHPDFARRAKVQRTDTVRALVAVAARLRSQCGGTPDEVEATLLAQAVRLVAKWRLK